MKQLRLDDSGMREASEENPQGTVSCRDGSGSNLVATGGTDRTELSQAGKGPPAVCAGNHITYPPHTTVVRLYWAEARALHGVPTSRFFDVLDAATGGMPDKPPILTFRHLLDRHRLTAAPPGEINALLGQSGLIQRQGTMDDATLVCAPTSTKKREAKHRREMISTRKGIPWYFGMKAHIGAVTANGLVDTVVGTVAKTADVTETDDLLHRAEQEILGDKRCTIHAHNLSMRDPDRQALKCFPFERRSREELPSLNGGRNHCLSQLRHMGSTPSE